ncbi:2-methylaconitate cis-trans isomerase PrpF [Zoogloeaceae bacterium G21618-S1]|nr:2-methylaconitate cis-trans isomerase PrpF [Zoogloeaceae bacterium G21618-S1]
MPQTRIPAAWMRGGTSKGVFFLASDLPADTAERDALLIRLLGSPDPYGKQIDGLGGATSSTSKVVIVSPAREPDCDVAYRFGQVLIDEDAIDWSGNCGNLTAAVGPFALWRKLVSAPANGEANIRLWQANVDKRIHARVPVIDGLPVEGGKFVLDGVAFPSAPITLTFLDPGSAEGGGILPTGNPVDALTLTDGTRIDASLVSAGNPMVFVSAHALGADCTASQAELNADAALRARCEQLRIAGALAMGLADSAEAAARRQHTPKLALVAPPAECQSVDGKHFAASDLDLLTRVLSMGSFHHAIPGTAAIAVAAAAGVPGSLVSRQLLNDPVGPLRIGHPSGRSEVGATTHTNSGQWILEAAVLRRSARMLMDGWACLPG